VSYAYAVKAGPWIFLTGHEAFERVARPTMPSADFCTAVRVPCGLLSPEGHGADLSE
jgi:hypothetical protein